MVAPTPSTLPPSAPPAPAAPAADGASARSSDARAEAGRNDPSGTPGGDRPAPDAALVQQFQALVQAAPAAGGAAAEGSGPALPAGAGPAGGWPMGDEPLTRWPLPSMGLQPGQGLPGERPLATDADGPADAVEPRTLSWPPMSRHEAPAERTTARSEAAPAPSADTPAEAETRAQAARHRAADADAPAPRDEPLPSPMALFQAPPADGPAPAPRAEPAAAPQPTAADLASMLAVRIERLAVSHAEDGHRRVSLSLDAAVLPDTDIEIGEIGGELVVNFFCHSIDARQSLEPQAPAMAGVLAERLQRAVCVSVGSPQRDEPGRIEARAQPGAAA